MKKNDVIEMLQKLKGNPEIVLWNGYVGDYQHIDNVPVEGVLVKQTLAHYLEMCRLQDCRDLNDPKYQIPTDEIEELKQLYKNVCKWEQNQYVTLEDIKAKRYSMKKVFYVQAKKRNERYHDRLGSVDY